jgi:hypothetical protein
MNIKKLLEVAGVDEHLKKEKTVFAKVQTSLGELHSFLEQQEGNEYSSLRKSCEALKEQLQKHLKRYE